MYHEKANQLYKVKKMTRYIASNESTIISSSDRHEVVAWVKSSVLGSLASTAYTICWPLTAVRLYVKRHPVSRYMEGAEKGPQDDSCWCLVFSFDGVQYTTYYGVYCNRVRLSNEVETQLNDFMDKGMKSLIESEGKYKRIIAGEYIPAGDKEIT